MSRIGPASEVKFTFGISYLNYNVMRGQITNAIDS